MPFHSSKPDEQASNAKDQSLSLSREAALEIRQSLPQLPPNPLSRGSLVAFFGINATFATLISAAANFIQVLTAPYGFAIFGAIFFVSLIGLIWRFIKYHMACIQILKQALIQKEQENSRLQGRLRKIIMYVHTTLMANVEAAAVTVWVNTKKVQANDVSARVVEVNSKVIVIDRGSLDGLVQGMYFALYLRGSDNPIDRCQVNLVEKNYAWLSHSGVCLVQNISTNALVFRCVDPPDIQSSDKQLGDIMLLAEGFDEHPEIIDI